MSSRLVAPPVTSTRRQIPIGKIIDGLGVAAELRLRQQRLCSTCRAERRTQYATREDIDAAMRLGCGLPMGPLALMDMIGIDTAYEILDTMYRTARRRHDSQ